MFYICEAKQNGLCKATEDECLHATSHALVSQQDSSTCAIEGLCITLGLVKCIPVIEKKEKIDGTTPNQSIQLVEGGE